MFWYIFLVVVVFTLVAAGDTRESIKFKHLYCFIKNRKMGVILQCKVFFDKNKKKNPLTNLIESKIMNGKIENLLHTLKICGRICFKLLKNMNLFFILFCWHNPLQFVASINVFNLIFFLKILNLVFAKLLSFLIFFLEKA